MKPWQSPLDHHARRRQALQLGVSTLLLTGLTVVAVRWGPSLWPALTDPAQLKSWLASYGPYAALLFVAAQFLQVVLFFVPGEVTQVAGGYLFGTWLGGSVSSRANWRSIMVRCRILL